MLITTPTPFAALARQARADVGVAAVAGDDAVALLRRVMRSIDRAVPFDAGGFTTTDPETLLWTGGVLRGLPPEAMAQFCELELLQPDALAFRTLVTRPRPVGLLSEATGGEPARAVRHRTMYAPHGLSNELRVAFRSRGRCFGTACLLRAAEEPDFTAQEVALVADVARDVADGLRAALATARVDASAERGAGVLVVDDDARVLSATDAAAGWLEELAASGTGTELPPVVHAVVAQARRRAAGRPGPPPRARAQTRAGTSLTVHASPLSGDQRAWSVILEPSRRSDVLRLLADAYDLTPRESEVLALLLRGMPDRVVAERLVVSPHTAREHAGRVLRKFGVRSRAELQALLFDEHHDPWLEGEDPASSGP